MKFSLIGCLLLLSLSSTETRCESGGSQGLNVSRVSNWEIAVKTSNSDIHCRIDQKLSDVKLSSDRQAIIVAGTSYAPMSDLMKCKAGEVVRTRKAAPHIGFLSDINLKAGIYASMVPVVVSPLSFVALVAKIGSDVSIIGLPGFYRKGIKSSRLQEEASTTMNPIISSDGKYVSLDLYDCGSESFVDVIAVAERKWIKLDSASCKKSFNF